MRLLVLVSALFLCGGCGAYEAGRRAGSGEGVVYSPPPSSSPIDLAAYALGLAVSVALGTGGALGARGLIRQRKERAHADRPGD